VSHPAVWIFLVPNFLLIARSLTFATPLPDSSLSTIRFDQKINSQVSLDLPFVDENGTPVALASCFHRKPVILVLVYYECPMLCSMVLNGMVESLQEMKPSIGTDFDVLNVSINPTETAKLAAAKKRTYLKRYGRSSASAGWHFLTGSEASITELTKEVGFNYVYDSDSKQYAHPSGLIVLTPQGKVSRYLFGIKFSATELNTALKEASANRTGSPIQQLVLLCFHYNPIHGKYGALIMIIVRSLAAATLVALLWLVISMVRREKRTALSTASSAASQ